MIPHHHQINGLLLRWLLSFHVLLHTTTLGSFHFDLVEDKCHRYDFDLNECADPNDLEQSSSQLSSTHCQCRREEGDTLMFNCLRSWASPTFEVGKNWSTFENHTLVYNTPHLGRLCHETFRYVKLARVEFRHGQNIDHIEHGTFKDAYIGAIVIDLGGRWVRNKTRFDSGVFTGLRHGTMTDDRECARLAAGSRGYRETDDITGACFSLEIQALITEKRYQMVAKAEIGADVLEGLEYLQRLTIIGNVEFRESSQMLPMDKLLGLRYLKLSGMAFVNSRDFLHPRLVADAIESLHLINDKNLALNDAHLKGWLRGRRHTLHQLSIEGGFSISGPLMDLLGTFPNLTHFSLRGTQIPEPERFHQAATLAFARELQVLDLGGTSITRPTLDFARFENVRQIILGNPVNNSGQERFCECTRYAWIASWEPYTKYGQNVFQEDTAGGISGAAENLLDKNRNLQTIRFKLPKGRADLRGCIDWCHESTSAAEATRHSALHSSILVLLGIALLCTFRT